MAFEQPADLQALCYTASEDRRKRWATSLVVAEGLVNITGDDLAVTTGGSGLDLDIAAGGAFIEGDDDSPDQGYYRVANNAVDTVTATAADATNPRIDQVIVTVRDAEYGGLDNDSVPSVLAGTPTGGATLSNLNGAEPLPDNAIRLAYVLVPATFTGPFVDATHILDARVVAGVGPKMLDYPAVWTGPTADASSVHRWTRTGGLITVSFEAIYDAGGSGDWTLSLPVPAATPAGYKCVGTGVYHVLSSGELTVWAAVLAPGGPTETVLFVEAYDNPGALLAGAAAVDDSFAGVFTYEPAV